MTTVLERYNALPRAVRWGLWAAAGLVFYFGAVEPVLDATARLRDSADVKAQRIETARSDSAAAQAADASLRAGLRQFGQILPPGEPVERSEALTRRIAAVLHDHDVRDHTSTVKETPLATGPLTNAMGTEYRVDRLIAELQFEASPEKFFGVLADLERAPEVAAVSRVQLRKATPPAGSKGPAPHILRASIAVEAWELVRKGRVR